MNIATNCTPTEVTIIRGMLITYSTPVAALPRNHSIPNMEEYMPYPKPLLFRGTSWATAARNIEPMAPCPKPQSIIPITMNRGSAPNTNGTKNAAMAKTTATDVMPIRSKK